MHAQARERREREREQVVERHTTRHTTSTDRGRAELRAHIVDEIKLACGATEVVRTVALHPLRINKAFSSILTPACTSNDKKVMMMHAQT